MNDLSPTTATRTAGLGPAHCIKRMELAIQKKCFFLSIMENNLGPFIRMAEPRKSTFTPSQQTSRRFYQATAGQHRQIESCLFMTVQTGVQIRDKLAEFESFCTQLEQRIVPPNEELPVTRVLKSHAMPRKNRTYYLDLKENQWGRFLQVSCVRAGKRSQIALPVQGLRPMQDALTQLVDGSDSATTFSENAAFATGFNSRTLQTVNESSLNVGDSNTRSHNNLSEHVDGVSPTQHLPVASRSRLSSSQPTNAQLATALLYSPQAISSLEAKPLLVSVHLRMSMRRTHLEVLTILGSEEQVLRSWQEAWKAKEPEQPDMPQPKPVTLPGVSVDEAIVARLTSTAKGGTTIYHHGCQETTHVALPGFGNAKQRAWLFRLDSEQPPNLQRIFSLHLHKAHPNFGSEICDAFQIKDFDGSCLIHQLGFTINNEPARQRTSDAALFGRPEDACGVQATQTIASIIEHTNSVGLIYLSYGPERGTGFCVGKDQKKYVMTCQHVLKDYKKDLEDRKVLIKFGYEHLGSAKSFVLGRCVAEDEKLDYAIFEIQGKGEPPQPISCCSTDFERLLNDADASRLFLTIVGFCGNIQAIDVGMDWLMPTERLIDVVKNEVATLSNQFLVSDYDEIRHSVNDMVFYNVARHKHGSSGSPVFLCKRDHTVKLVALHRRGFPGFYYNENTKNDAQKLIPVQYTIEAGTRISAIYGDLRRKDEQLCQKIFDIETLPMDIS